MKLRALLLVAMVMGLSSTSLQGEEMPEQIRQKLEKHFIGDWIDTQIWDGEESISLVRRRWSEDKRTLLVDSVNAGSQNHEVGHWTGNAFVVHGLTSDGNTWVITFNTLDDERWTGHGVGTWQGGPWSSNLSMDWTEDGFRYEDTTEGKPFVVTGRRPFAKSGAASVESLGEFMVGGVWTRTDEDGNELKHAYDWDFEKKFFKLTTLQDPEPSSLRQGVDPLTGLHHLWSFGTNGFAQGTSMQLSETQWVFIGSAESPDGLVKGRWDLIATNEDTLTVRREVTIGDSEEKLSREAVWKRVKEQPLPEVWLEYLEGTWEFQFDDGRKGIVNYTAAGKAQALALTGEAEEFSIIGVIGWQPASKKFVETDFAYQDGAKADLHRDFTMITEERIIGVQTWWDSEIGSGSQPLEYRKVSDKEMTLTGKASETGGIDWVVRFLRK